MKFYLSSFKLGDKSSELARLMGKNKRIAYVPNACDYTNVDLKRREKVNQEDIKDLRNLGLEVELLDLKDYFGKENELMEKISRLGGIFFRGGNTFILRQAMRLGGFDNIFKKLLKRDDFVYAGYSAGICVLCKNFGALRIVDNPSDKPYPELQETIWEGLDYFDYMILPHYKSDHPESADIDKEVEFCKKNSLPFKTLRDGEVIIIE